jgi:hypothetical protein
LVRLSAKVDDVAYRKNEHDTLMFGEVLGLKVCLDHFEVFLHPNPETRIRADIEMLRIR